MSSLVIGMQRVSQSPMNDATIRRPDLPRILSYRGWIRHGNWIPKTSRANSYCLYWYKNNYRVCVKMDSESFSWQAVTTTPPIHGIGKRWHGKGRAETLLQALEDADDTLEAQLSSLSSKFTRKEDFVW